MSKKVSPSSATSSSEKSFIPSDGRTLFKNERGEITLFADFSLKLVGEVHATTKGNVKDYEGQWLASMTGFVFSQKITRLITLKGSDFDNRTSLLSAIRAGFPGGSVTISTGVKNELINAFWHWLLSNYEPGSGIKVYSTDHWGVQDRQNYWIINPETHLWKNSVVPKHEQLFHVTNLASLLPYSTDMNVDLLNKDVLLESCKRLLEVSTYLGINYSTFLLVLGFVLSRLLRSNNSDDVWAESNIGMVYSPNKNCGKSMTLYILSKLQGLTSRHHPLLPSGGNQGTSGTSTKKVLETLSMTTLMVMMDDPIITSALGEFLNQAQGGLMQGSTSTGLYAPKGSLLLSSNDREVTRIEGRVQRFTFTRDDDFQLNEERERNLLTFAEGNKGFLIAWTMRYMSLWHEFVDEYAPTIQNVIRCHFPGCQIRWIRGLAYSVLAKTMFLASADRSCNIVQTITDLVTAPSQEDQEQSKPLLPTLMRFQRAVYESIQKDLGKVHTWINPFCTVKVNGSNKAEKAYAFSIAGINLLNAEIDNKELSDKLKETVPSGIGQPITFANSADVPLALLHKKLKKDNEDNKPVSSKRAHKIPGSYLDPSFVQWLEYALFMEKKPDKEFEVQLPESVDDVDEQIGYVPFALAQEVEQIEQTVLGRMSEFNQSQQNNRESATDKQFHSHHIENLSPSSRREWDAFTPRRRRAFEMGAQAASKKLKTTCTVTVGTCTSPRNEDISTASTSIKETPGVLFCPEASVSSVRVEPRKELFPEGAIGVVLGKEQDGSKSAAKSKRKTRRK